MSAQHATAGHGDHHDDDDIAYHATVKGYVVGFMLSVILTAIPFWLVMAKVLPTTLTSVIILAFAAVQMVVHVVYFLHLDRQAQGGWNLLALIFTIVLLFILLSGSIWVMYHMNENMMPVDPQMMRNMP
ncbi:MAG: cytochrome o ubiquinol oxidase subunit IV [Burkholderiales bacterium]